MIDGKRVLGIVPARGGSKRLPRKNIAPLSGQPLIAHTIEAGLASESVDELMLSTEDPQIAEVAATYGARVPFMRPPALATDLSGTFEVIRHAVEYYKDEEGREFQYMVLLQPTSPLRDGKDIDAAFDLLARKQADAVISVCQAEHSPLWANTLDRDLSMAGFLDERVKSKRSQDLETYYRINGAIYICDIPRLMEEKTRFIKSNIYAFVMPREKSVDIDTWLDLKLCEVLIEALRGRQLAGKDD